MNTQSEKPKFYGTKTDPKKISKIPMPPLWMNRSVQSRAHTNDNTTTIIITETSTKTLFIVIIFQSETCCKTTLVTRYFSGKVSCHAIESFVDYVHRCLTPRLQPRGFFFFFVIIDLHFMAKWRSPSFKNRRGFDLLRTPQRCSYFQFVSFRLSNHSKP